MRRLADVHECMELVPIITWPFDGLLDETSSAEYRSCIDSDGYHYIQR